jgi:hypothetical protein
VLGVGEGVRKSDRADSLDLGKEANDFANSYSPEKTCHGGKGWG